MSSDQNLLHPKKAGALPIANSEEVKRINEIKTAIPMLEAIDIKGKDISADALLTHCQLAEYLVTELRAHYHFTVTGKQPGILQDLELYFRDRKQPQFIEQAPSDHGRIETRKIWTTTERNNNIDFPYVGQAFVIERQCIEKRAVNILWKLPGALPVEPQRKLVLNRCSRSIADIGLLRTAATTFLIGITTRIAAEYG